MSEYKVTVILLGLLIAIVALSSYMIGQRDEPKTPSWDDLKEMCLDGVRPACVDLIEQIEHMGEIK